MYCEKLQEEFSFREELEPFLDSARSFYYKARVYCSASGTLLLTSYNTPVCAFYSDFEKNEKYVLFFDDATYSATTLRHVKDFCARTCDSLELTKANIEKLK